MIDNQIDEEMMLIDEVSDETLEATALVALGGFPTLPHTYCFACPVKPSGLENNDLCFKFLLDQDQIVEDWYFCKIGTGSLPQRRARPRSRPPSPDENPRGRGRHFPKSIAPRSYRAARLLKSCTYFSGSSWPQLSTNRE